MSKEPMVTDLEAEMTKRWLVEELERGTKMINEHHWQLLWGCILHLLAGLALGYWVGAGMR